MPSASSSQSSYFHGQAEVYAETVSRTKKPLGNVFFTYEDKPTDRLEVKRLTKYFQEIARRYGIKCYARKTFQEFRESRNSPIYKIPAVDYCFYKEEKVLKQYLAIISKKELTLDDHRKLGKIFGYTQEIIEKFIKGWVS